MLPPVSPLAEAEGATCIIQVLSHHYQRAVHGTSISRSVSRTFLCQDEGANEPFPMYQSISSVVVLDPPFSSIRCSFTHSFALRSFVCSLLAHCAKVHSGKRTKVSQRRGKKKERRKRRFASKRRGGGRRERMCALLAFTESAVVQRNRITLHTIERMAANFRSSSFAATRQPTTFCRLSFNHGRDSAFEGTARSSIRVRSHMFQPRGPKLFI